MANDDLYQRSQACKARREAEYQRKRAERFEAENKDLRELVRELLPCFLWSDCISGCKAIYTERCPTPSIMLAERAKELGIEV